MQCARAVPSNRLYGKFITLHIVLYLIERTSIESRVDLIGLVYGPYDMHIRLVITDYYTVVYYTVHTVYGFDFGYFGTRIVSQPNQ